MTLTLVSDSRLNAEVDKKEVIDLLQSFIDRLNDGTMRATNALVVVSDMPDPDMFALNVDAHGRYLETIGMLDVAKARLTLEVLG